MVDPAMGAQPTQGTVDKPSVVVLFWPCLTPPPPSWFYVVLRETSPPSPKKHVVFLKKIGYLPAGCLSQKNTGYLYYLLYFMNEIRYNANQSVSISDGERKGGCERRRRFGENLRKRCAFKDSVSYVPGLTAGFSQKKTTKKDHRSFL